VSSQSSFLDQPPRCFEDPLSCSEKHEAVTVLFSDIVGFTSLSEQLTPTQVMALLADLYSKLDDLAEELQVYPVDTIGDCYMCAANLIQPVPNHAAVMVEFGQRMIQIANSTMTPMGTPLVIRVGINTGPLMSGILGSHRMKFTLVGDTVNVASRMESTALPNTIQVSSETYEQLHLPRAPITAPPSCLPWGAKSSEYPSKEGDLSCMTPKDEGTHSSDSTQSNVTEQSGREGVSRCPSHIGTRWERTHSSRSANSSVVAAEHATREGGLRLSGKTSEGAVHAAGSKESDQNAGGSWSSIRGSEGTAHTAGSKESTPNASGGWSSRFMRNSSSGCGRAAALLEQAVLQRARMVGRAPGPSQQAGVVGLPLGSTCSIGCAPNWRARDLEVKGKGSMRAFYMSVGHQTVEALTLSDD